MTDMTDDQVRALLDGATPGPWRADGEPWNRIVWSSADNRVCFMAHSSGLNDARDTATSNLVAAAPDLARALLDARAERDDAFAAGVVHGQNALRAITGPLQVVDSPELAELRAELARVKADAPAAQTPTDPGDGWTWNERLGWIGPDGKPAARGGA